VAALKDCCEGFDEKTIRCVYDPGCDVATYPTLSPSESECIRAKSCSEIREQGICKRVRDREAEKDVAPSNEEFVPSQEVCE
jgi:hypothetical protein